MMISLMSLPIYMSLGDLESLEIIENDRLISFPLSHKLNYVLSSRIKRFKCPNAKLYYWPTFSMMTSYCQSSKLEELDLSSSITLTDEMITFIAAKSPNLKTLNIKNSFVITEQGILSIVAFCPLMERLFSCVTLTPHSMKELAGNCTNLHTLKLISTSKDNEVLTVIGEQCQYLRAFSAAYVSKQGICAIASGCPLLTSLALYGSGIDNHSLYIIAEKAINLKELCMYECSSFTCAGVNAIAQKCRKLEVLMVLSDADLQRLNFVSQHKTVLCLKQLLLPETNVTDACIEYITKLCTKLELLDLSSCGRLTHQALCSIAENFPDLRRLSIEFNETKPMNHAKVPLAALAERLHNLQIIKITLKKSSNKVHGCLVLFIEKCPFLKELELFFRYKDKDEESLEEQANALRHSVLLFRSQCNVIFLIKNASINIEMTSLFQ